MVFVILFRVKNFPLSLAAQGGKWFYLSKSTSAYSSPPGSQPRAMAYFFQLELNERSESFINCANSLRLSSLGNFAPQFSATARMRAPYAAGVHWRFFTSLSIFEKMVAAAFSTASGLFLTVPFAIFAFSP